MNLKMRFCVDSEPNFDRAFKEYLLCAISNRGNASKERITLIVGVTFLIFAAGLRGLCAVVARGAQVRDDDKESQR